MQKQNKEYEIKINYLENKINLLEREINIMNEKLFEKDIKINQIFNEKDKNDKFQRYKIEELEHEIKKLESYFLQPGEKLLTINFISTDQIINHTLYAKDSEFFTVLESKLYSIFPKYAEQENYFLGHGIKINRYKTLKENGIKNNEILTLKKFDEI